MYLISPHMAQFKANLHCHSTRSDGRLTPSELKNAYRQHGYQILSITDHEAPKDHSAMSETDFLFLTGYEAYIRPDPLCRYDKFSPEIHLNLFAKNPHNETIIGYNPACCKYLSDDEQSDLQKAGPTQVREYTTAYINEFIAAARENGYLVSYNHPVWSMESENSILSYNGIFSMEIVNYNSDTINHNEYNGALYDKLLSNEKYWFVHAADDNHNVYPFKHPQCDSFGAFTMICAESLSYDHVIEAMEQGNMYASTGPLFHEISVADNIVSIKCSDVAVITCHIGSKHPDSVQAFDGETVNEACFTIPSNARYVRISILDRNGKRADTRGYSLAELFTDHAN